ncbi:hypothetical protein AC249_AIPGENE915 [Exaiptasia diaphana]|nr:hypothetical protein AC249_AIPGENE915 [Exaiptasia diaphana]
MYDEKMIIKHFTCDGPMCAPGMVSTLYEQLKTLKSFAGLKNSRLDLDALVLSVREALKDKQTMKGGGGGVSKAFAGLKGV